MHTNRLINESSTYLLQHAHNPVDWYPWGEEALQRARREDKPILLSVGYSACHWCHVMEHESFEDPETATLMNDNFVNIKVDREERPDIDDIYMKAVQMLTGHGGWPMTVFLTPDLKPFFAGTYFPPQDRQGMPSFRRVLAGVLSAWKGQRQQVESSSSEITAQLGVFDKVPEGDEDITRELIERSIERLWNVFDRQWGGLGNAPKFPHASILTLLTWNASRKGELPQAVKEHAREMLTTTLNRMAYGGMYDQVGGGFARYSVDRQWLVPHFEKMLYDNAQLARNYLQAHQLTGNQYWARIGRETLDFVLRELTTPDGVFYSSLDADTDGAEGKFYIWRADEIRQLLGAADADWLGRVYGITSAGNFEHNTNVLHLSESPDALAKNEGLSTDEFWRKLEALRQILFEAREKRTRPGRDEKVLLSWSSLMISALVEGYRALGERKYLLAAKRAAEFFVTHMLKDGRLMRTWGRGQAKLQGYLDDYAYFIQALLDLAAVDFEPQWLEHAVQLTEVMLSQFSDPKDGEFFYTSHEHERLIARTKAFYDSSTPSPSAIACMNLLKLADIMGKEDWKQRAAQVIRVYLPFFEKVPDQFASFLCAVQTYMAPPVEIVFVADIESDGWEPMLQTINRSLIPAAVQLVKDAGKQPSSTQAKSPLLEDKALINGAAAAYVCRNFTCDRPSTDETALSEKLRPLALNELV